VDTNNSAIRPFFLLTFSEIFSVKKPQAEACGNRFTTKEMAAFVTADMGTTARQFWRETSCGGTLAERFPCPAL
jgi:hypothetical protein